MLAEIPLTTLGGFFGMMLDHRINIAYFKDGTKLDIRADSCFGITCHPFHCRNNSVATGHDRSAPDSSHQSARGNPAHTALTKSSLKLLSKQSSAIPPGLSANCSADCLGFQHPNRQRNCSKDSRRPRSTRTGFHWTLLITFIGHLKDSLFAKTQRICFS